MRPTTSYEKEVVRLSRQLPEIADRYKQQACKLINYKEARQYRGHKTHIIHFLVVTTKGGWQVIRHVYLYAAFKYKRLFKTSTVECMQQWYRGGKYVFMALPRQMGYVDDAWCTGQPMTIKKNYDHCSTLSDPRCIGYDLAIYARVQPLFSYLPTDEQTGIRVDDMFRAVNVSPFWETVIKRSPQLFKLLEKRGMTTDSEKTAAVRVALRHGYDVQTTEWADLVEMLKFVGKDLHNPKYVAPADLNAMHDEICKLAMAKRKKLNAVMEERSRIRRERQELEWQERRARMAKEREEREKAMINLYPIKRKKFFGVIIAGKGIEIRALQSVQEFMEEGAAMHHCVFANGYYDVNKKPDCLILSAKKDGERVETIEVDLSDYRVVQSRGKHNQPTKYHDTILELMKTNMDAIRNANRRRTA
jgi:hypothetical protein